MKYGDEKLREMLSKLINLELTDSKITNYIIENYYKMLNISFSQFINDLSIEEEEAYEFLKTNGYYNFNDFKCKLSDGILNLIRDKDPSLLKNITSIDKEEIRNILSAVIEVENKNMRDMLNTLEYDKFVKLIKDIMSFPELIIIGTRVSAILAQYASYILNKIGINVKKITSADTTSFDNIQNFDRSSLVIAFGFKRYPKETIKLLNYFSRKNFKIVSITDEPESPLCDLSSYSIFVQAHSLAYTDSLVNSLALINAIAIAIGKADNKKVVKRLREFEETAKTLDYFW
ncbi:MAG: MurR/RpiR family transcriptional regulator [Clostridiales bacterium]|nr:MurR/RpiR family transcriptional regulator [Clostridiales bacterium]